MRRASVLGVVGMAGIVGMSALAACDDTPVRNPSFNDDNETRLESDTGVSWVLERDLATNTVRLAFPKSPTPIILPKGADAFATAASFLIKYPEIFGVKSTADLKSRETVTDTDGVTHVSFDQVVSGAPADFARIDLHFFADGSINHVSGPFYPNLNAISQQTPKISASAAQQAAVAGATNFGAPSVTAGAATLKVALDDKGAPRLQYFVQLTSNGTPLIAEVDADSGAFLRVLHTRQTLRASGTGVDGKRESFDIDAPTDGTFVMKRSRQNNRPEVAIYDATSANPDTLKVDIIRALPLVTSDDKDNWEQDVPEENKGVAVDCMAKFQQVESWFRSRFGYVSFDDGAAPIVVATYLNDDNEINAFYANGNRDDQTAQRRFFGFQVAPGKQPVTEFDVVAHEFMHAVTAYTTGLIYGGQSGALNESMSDIFAQLVEHDVRPSGDPALVGDEFKRPMRSMRDPSKIDEDSIDHVDQIDQVIARLSRFKGYDNGGVHMLSGIPNLAWYLMTFGGAHPRGTRIPGRGIGFDASRAIYWDLTRHGGLHSYSNFRDAAQSTLLIARYKRIDRRAIGCAWNAVGVLGADELRTNYDIDCAGDADAGADLCAGTKGNQIFCHPELPQTAVYCYEGTMLATTECDTADASGAQRCVSAEIVDDNFVVHCVPTGLDSCVGKEDGYYCSEIPGAEYAAYYCKDERISSGQFCPTGKRCAGFDDQNEIVCE